MKKNCLVVSSNRGRSRGRLYLVTENGPGYCWSPSYQDAERYSLSEIARLLDVVRSKPGQSVLLVTSSSIVALAERQLRTPVEASNK